VFSWIEDLRRAKGYSQQRLAQEAGISQSYYSAIVLGVRGVKPRTAKKIAKVLGFDWTKFYEEE